ncbi:MAG: 6-bladed beta-propeller [Thermodesulfobacteriota bacterium]
MKSTKFTDYRAGWVLGLFLLALLSGCATSRVDKEAGPVFYPAAPDTPRIQFLTKISDSRDTGKPVGALTKFILGEGAVQINAIGKPHGLALSQGKLYLVDNRPDRILVVELASGKFGEIGGKRRLNFVKPINLVVDTDGTKYIADTQAGKIIVLNAQDQPIRSFGKPEDMKPSDMVVSGDLLFVADIKDHEIEVFNKKTGKLVYKIGKNGKGEGEFVFPTNLALDTAGNLYVADTGNFRVQKLTPQGKLLKVFGGLGDQPGYFHRPKGIAVDRQGRLYVVDATFQNIQIFDDQGRLLLYFGGRGYGPGDLNLPVKVIIDYDHISYFKKYAAPGFELEYLILVTSQFGPNKINIYGFGHPSGNEAGAEKTARSR